MRGGFSAVCLLRLGAPGVGRVVRVAVKKMPSSRENDNSHFLQWVSRETRDATCPRPAAVRECTALFEREVQPLQALGRHNGIVKSLCAGHYNGHSYLVMEAATCDMRDVLNHWGALDGSVVLAWTIQIAEAIAHMHKCRQVHRDITASNVLVFSLTCVKISDFGLSEYADAPTLEAVGSLEYAAPEILMRTAVDIYATDVWSLGVLVVVMALGRVPFASGATPEDPSFHALMRGHWNPPLCPKVASIVRASLVVDPRYRSTIQNIVRHLRVASASRVVHEEEFQFGELFLPRRRAPPLYAGQAGGD